MTGPAPVIAPAARPYRDKITSPERREKWMPNWGDIPVCTPPKKGGTTWTQTTLAMLVHGGADLPMKLPVLSPWVDLELGVPASEVGAALATQTGQIPTPMTQSYGLFRIPSARISRRRTTSIATIWRP